MNQIAFRLERNGADTYKVRAFRGAARAIKDVPDDDLEALAKSGRLQSIEGVGKSTRPGHRRGAGGQGPRVPHQDRQGTTKDDLVVEGAAAELLASLRGDCHSHSDWSDGGSPIHEMAEAARDLGRDTSS